MEQVNRDNTCAVNQLFLQQVLSGNTMRPGEGLRACEVSGCAGAAVLRASRISPDMTPVPAFADLDGTLRDDACPVSAAIEAKTNAGVEALLTAVRRTPKPKA